MSKYPTEFEASELIFVLKERKGSKMSKRLLCRELDVDRKWFDKLLVVARKLADKEGLLIMNDGSDNFYLKERIKKNAG